VKTSEKTLLLSKWIDDARTVCTVCHTRPDGDAVGSSVAAYAYLTACRHKNATILLPDAHPQSIDFLLEGITPRINDASPLEACDLLICLDFNTFSRTESISGACGSFAGRKVLIDHHEAPDESLFDLCFSTTEVSSTCELLFDILMQMPDIAGDASKLPPRAAFALMTGMTTDTNNFANSVWPGTLAMASALLQAGVDRQEILDKLYSSGREQRLRALGDILRNRLIITPEGAAVTVLTKEIQDTYSLLEGETEGFVNVPLEIRQVRLSIFARQEEEGVFRVSIRSKRGTSARLLATSVFHGGGHEQAAGGKIFIPQDIPDASAAEAYVLSVTARFMQQKDAPQK